MIKLSYLMDMQFNLQDVIESMAGRRGMKSIGNMVNKLILAATVYFIWQERNFRLFKEECRSEDVLFNIIYECVKSKLMTIRVKKTVRTDLIEKKWNLRAIYLGNKNLSPVLILLINGGGILFSVMCKHGVEQALLIIVIKWVACLGCRPT
ncbi:hypothetical protein Tco_0964699 [Tanacetum coccineum]